MKFLSLATIVVSITSVLGAAPKKRFDRGVLIANDNNYEDVIYNPEAKYSFINYYRQACTHCNKLGPQIEIVAELFNNSQVQIVQVDGKLNKRVRRLENIVGFPTMRLFGFDGTHISSFTGERTAEQIAEFISDYTGVQPKWPEKKTIEVKSADEFNELINEKSGDLLVAFVAPWLEDWNTRISQFDKVALEHFKNNDPLKFVSVDITNEHNSKILTDFRITKYPSLVHYNIKDGSFRILDHDTDDLNVKKFDAFVYDVNIGDTYSDLAELHYEKEQVNTVNEGIAGKGYGFNKDDHQIAVDPEVEEEKYRRLREL